MARFLTASEVVEELDSESEDEFDGYIEETYEHYDGDGEIDWFDNECAGIDENDDRSSSPDSSSSHALDSSEQSTSGGCSSSPFQCSGSTITPGCIVDMSGKSPMECLQLFLTCTILENIVKEINRYADDYIQSHNIPCNSRVHKWKPCNLEEIKKFIAIIIGVTVDGKTRIEDYWSTSWPFSTNAFSSVMSRNRFQLLLRFFHLNDSKLCKKRGQPGYDPLFKIRPFMAPLQQNFKNCYNLHREVSVDESMIGFKGRLWFIQYMPKKPTKWGMKAFVLADSLSGYTYSWKLYAGKKQQQYYINI